MTSETQNPSGGVDPQKYIDAGNVMTSFTLVVMGLAVAILPESALPGFCGLLGRVHIALRGSKADDLTPVPDLEQAGIGPRILEQQLMKRSYEELAQPFLERRKKGWHPEIILEGREHLDRALTDGHGAVIWVVPSFSGEIVFRKAIHASGLPLVDLRTPGHPYSETTFGQKYLNPVRVEIENRYMTERLVLKPKDDTEMLLKLKDQLKQNRIVKFMASPNGKNPPEFPLFGGRFAMALGAPGLAKLGKAPLIPAFVAETQPGHFTVRIGAPLEMSGRGAGRAAWNAIGAEFVDQMKDHVLRNPDQWPGWFARDAWTPDTSPEELEPATA